MFSFDGFKKYLKYVTIQGGMFGIFTERTPRELIEGYTDPLIETLTQMPIYQGGDTTNSPFLSIIDAPTNPKDNTIAFMQGSGTDDWDYYLTRSYVQWLGNSDVKIKGKDYEDLNTTVDVYKDPWSKPVQVNGTDGFQFHPMV